MANLIKVKPIDTASWHGKKGYESFRKPKTIQALVNASTQTYATGLDDVVKAFPDPDSDSDKKVLTEKAYYSKVLNADLSDRFNEEIPHPFWDTKTARIKLENRTMIFDLDNPLDYVKVKILKRSKYVANSVDEFNKGMFPEATHIIFDENENVEEKANKIAQRNSAIGLTLKLTKEQKVNLVATLSLSDSDDFYKAKVLRDKSENFVDVELNKYIENSPDLVISYIKGGKERLETEALVIECLQKSHLTKDGHRIKYFDSVLGQSIHEVTDYLMIDKNQDLKLRLKALINK